MSCPRCACEHCANRHIHLDLGLPQIRIVAACTQFPDSQLAELMGQLFLFISCLAFSYRSPSDIANAFKTGQTPEAEEIRIIVETVQR